MSAGGGVLARLAALEHEVRMLRLRVTSEQGGGVPAAPHASTHSDGASDEVDVTDLAGYPGGSPKTYLDSDGAFTTPDGSGIVFPGGSPLTYLDSDGNFSSPAGGGGGGGGDSTHTAAYASRPAASNAGDLFFPSDGFAVERDTGAAWVPWGPIHPFTAPVDGDFAWINQGSATVTAAKGAIYLDSVDASGGLSTYDINIRKKAAPSTPYTITAAFMTNVTGEPILSCGLVWRQSSDGKLITLEYDYTSAWILGAAKWTNPTTHSGANYTLTSGGVLGGRLQLIWMRLADNGTNRIMSFSVDGQNWWTLHTVGRTDFLTADEVGFYVNAIGTTLPCNMTLLSWKQE